MTMLVAALAFGLLAPTSALAADPYYGEAGVLTGNKLVYWSTESGLCDPETGELTGGTVGDYGEPTPGYYNYLVADTLITSTTSIGGAGFRFCVELQPVELPHPNVAFLQTTWRGTDGVGLVRPWPDGPTQPQLRVTNITAELSSFNSPHPSGNLVKPIFGRFELVDDPLVTGDFSFQELVVHTFGGTEGPFSFVRDPL